MIVKYQTLFLIAIIFWNISCSGNQEIIPETIPLDSVGVETILKPVLYYSDSNQVKVQIQGPSMYRKNILNRNTEIFSQGIIGNFFSQGSITSTITAGYAIHDPVKKEFIASKNVILRNNQGETLESEELIWNSDRHTISTTRFVILTTNKERIWGQGFETDEHFRKGRVLAIEGSARIDAIDKELK